MVELLTLKVYCCNKCDASLVNLKLFALDLLVFSLSVTCIMTAVSAVTMAELFKSVMYHCSMEQCLLPFILQSITNVNILSIMAVCYRIIKNY